MKRGLGYVVVIDLALAASAAVASASDYAIGATTFGAVDAGLAVIAVAIATWVAFA